MLLAQYHNRLSLKQGAGNPEIGELGNPEIGESGNRVIESKFNVKSIITIVTWFSTRLKEDSQLIWPMAFSYNRLFLF